MSFDSGFIHVMSIVIVLYQKQFSIQQINCVRTYKRFYKLCTPIRPMLIRIVVLVTYLIAVFLLIEQNHLYWF